jgi:DNA-binding MarR family transcriptional regulator
MGSIVYGIHRLGDPSSGGSIVYGIHRLWDPSSGGSIVWGIHRLGDPSSGGSIVYGIHRLWDPSSMGSIVYGIHRLGDPSSGGSIVWNNTYRGVWATPWGADLWDMGATVARNGTRRTRLLFEAAPVGLRNRVSFVIWRMAILLRRRGSKRLAKLGLAPHHYAILSCLEERGTCCQAALCERTGIDRSALTAPIDALLDRELIGREVDEADRRRDDIRLTAAGARILERAERALNEVEDELLRDLSAQERVALGELVGRVIGCARNA